MATGGGYDQITATVSAINRDDDQPPGLVTDKTTLVTTEDPDDDEAPGNRFTVKLATEPTATVTVAVTGWDTTEGELDKTSLTFAPTRDQVVSGTTSGWNVAQTVTVTGVDDDLDDGDMDYEIRLMATGGGYDQITATVSVTNQDDEDSPFSPQEQRRRIHRALLGTLSRVRAQLALDAIDSRFDCVLAGHREEEDTSAPWSEERLGDALRAVGLGGSEALADDGGEVTREHLLRFGLQLSRFGVRGASCWPDRGVWGAGGRLHLDGHPEQDGLRVDYDGEIIAWHVGVDRMLSADLLGGMSLGWSLGKAEYAGAPVLYGRPFVGQVEHDLVTAHPYLAWRPSPELHAWFVGGVGQGTYQVSEEQESGARRAQTDASLLMGALGVKRQWRFDEDGDLLLHASGLWTRSALRAGRFDDGERLPALAATTWRWRAGVEAGRQLATDQVAMRPYGLLGLRWDGGAAALEAGVGLQLDWAAAGLALGVEVRTDVNDTAVRERRVSGTLSHDRGGDGRGLVVSVAQSLEGTRRNAWDQAWEAAEPGWVPVLEARAGYGWLTRLMRRSGVLAPFVRARTGLGERRVGLGLEFEAGDAGFTLEGEQRDDEGAAPQRRLSFRARRGVLSWEAQRSDSDSQLLLKARFEF